MCSVLTNLARGLGLALGVVLATTAQGQQITVARAAQEKVPPPKEAPPGEAGPASVHKIVIFEGPNRKVNYVTRGDVSTSDRLAALELERAENELTYVGDLQRLKQQYVNSERILEPQRRATQEQLYGTSINYGQSFAGYGSVGGGYGRGYYPYVFGSYGYGGGLANGYVGSSYLSVSRSLQNGMGDEGRFKDAMVQVIAQQSSPEYAAYVLRNYDGAVARAASSPTLARSLGLQKGPMTYAAYEPTFTKGGNIVIWVGTDKYAGKVKDDRGGWVIIQTDKGEVSIRKSEITRSEVPAKPG